MPAGRPPFEITDDVIKKVEFHASRGLTLQQIGDMLGICHQTFIEKRKENTELVEALKRGQANGIATITNALFSAAKTGNTTAQIFYLKCRAKWKEADLEVVNDDSLQKAKEQVTELKSDDHGRPTTAES